MADMLYASRAEVYRPKGFLGKEFSRGELPGAGPKALTTKLTRKTKESAELSVSFVMDLR